MFRIEAEEIEFINGKSVNSQVAIAHEVFDRFCGEKSRMRRMEAEEIAARQGALQHSSMAYADANIDKSHTFQWLIFLSEDAAIAASRG